MEQPRLLSPTAGDSAARTIDEMSRLYYVSRAIHAVAELGIADYLGSEHISASRLASETGASVSGLRRLLRFLSAYGIFEECADDTFRNTELSSVLCDDHPQSVRANLRRIREFWWSTVGDLEHTIRTGETAFVHQHGIPFFEYLKSDTDIQKRFDEAMARISDADDAAIAAAYDFSRFTKIADLGGGRGGLLAQILAGAPAATAILFEQPQVLAQPSRLDEARFADRIEKTSGDFFEAVPAGADVYVIKGVLHDFDDDQCVQILSNCRSALDGGGSLVIANQDLPEAVDCPHPNRTMDIQMMLLMGGRERTATEWSKILRQSGFKMSAVIDTGVGFILIEGTPD